MSVFRRLIWLHCVSVLHLLLFACDDGTGPSKTFITGSASESHLLCGSFVGKQTLSAFFPFIESGYWFLNAMKGFHHGIPETLTEDFTLEYNKIKWTCMRGRWDWVPLTQNVPLVCLFNDLVSCDLKICKSDFFIQGASSPVVASNQTHLLK